MSPHVSMSSAVHYILPYGLAYNSGYPHYYPSSVRRGDSVPLLPNLKR